MCQSISSDTQTPPYVTGFETARSFVGTLQTWIRRGAQLQRQTIDYILSDVGKIELSHVITYPPPVLLKQPFAAGGLNFFESDVVYTYGAALMPNNDDVVRVVRRLPQHVTDR